MVGTVRMPPRMVDWSDEGKINVGDEQRWDQKGVEDSQRGELQER